MKRKRKPLKNILLLLSMAFILSCNKEDTINVKDQLIGQDWEEKTGIVGNINYGRLKEFYKLSFKADNTFEINIDYLGVSGIPDPIILDTIGGKYEFDPNLKIISFPEAVDTTYLISGTNNSTKYYVFFAPWEIIQINDTLLIVETKSGYSPPKEPALVLGLGGERRYFGPIIKK